MADQDPSSAADPERPARRYRGIFDSWLMAYAAAGLWLFVAVIGVLSKNGAQAAWLVTLNFLIPVPLAALGTWGFFVARRHDRLDRLDRLDDSGH